ncbi:hypothetical protein IQ250_09375 [Pseudanabaenaceae cyanobacterium LEGE 13415]|nr:hypothetical protein [Pseudanabaenaceae cyanobacterium LEGE 13415]
MSWQNYCDRVDESNPVKRDEKVARLAIADGRRHKLPSRELIKAVNQLLQDSPYIQWMREIQGDEKTDNYVKLTIQAARQSDKVPQRQKSHQRHRQRSRQRSL